MPSSSYSTTVDIDYYKNKYKPLNCDDNITLIQHYKKIGKKKGYFPNREVEIFFCKNQNFDAKYYVRKYNLVLSKSKAREHWKNYGFKKNYFINICEELGEHSKFSCKCKIKGKSKEYFSETFSIYEPSNYSDNNTDNCSESYSDYYSQSLIDSVKLSDNNDSIIHDLSDCDSNSAYTNNSELSEDLLKRAEKSINQDLNNQSDFNSQLSDSSYNSIQYNSNQNHKHNSNHSNYSNYSNYSNMSDESCHCHECNNEKKYINKIRNNKIRQNLQTINEISENTQSLEITYHGNDNTNSKYTNNEYDESEYTNSEYTNSEYTNNEYTNNEYDENEYTNKNEDDIFETEYIDEKYSENINSGCNKSEDSNIFEIRNKVYDDIENASIKDIGILDSDNIDKLKEDIRLIKDKMYQKEIELLETEINDVSEVENKTESIMNSSISIKDLIDNDKKKLVDIKLKINDTMDKDKDIDLLFDINDKFMFNKQMDMVIDKIDYVNKYLNYCNIHLNSLIGIVKQAYACIPELGNNNSNYMLYNASRIKLCTMIKEMDKIIKNSKFENNLVFRAKNSDNNTIKYLKFPIFVSNNRKMNSFFENTIGKENMYFKIELVNVSLKSLKINKYILPPLSKNEIMTNNSNPIPPDNCVIGKEPDKNMYDNENLKKNWSINHHIDIFEKALYRCSMYRNIIDNYVNLLKIKKELCLKIKLDNLK
jgi:hypothetical protein